MNITRRAYSHTIHSVNVLVLSERGMNDQTNADSLGLCVNRRRKKKCLEYVSHAHDLIFRCISDRL